MKRLLTLLLVGSALVLGQGVGLGPADGHPTVYNGTIDSDDPTMAVVAIASPDCSTQLTTQVRYEVFAISDPVPGPYAIAVHSEDDFAGVYLYEGSFDPEDGMTNCVAADNSGSPLTIDYELEAGTPYFVVIFDDQFDQLGGDYALVIDPPATFSDVPFGHPFYEEISWMAEEGISTGFGDGTYGPGLGLTRQAMSAFLYRFFESPFGADPDCGTVPFPDVPIEHPFCGEISWMSFANISTGFGDGTYGPGLGLTRQAMSAFLYRAAGEPNGPDPVCGAAPFPDVPIEHPFCGEIAWMADEGISNGFGDGSYGPGLALTRQAMSAFLFRFADVMAP